MAVLRGEGFVLRPLDPERDGEALHTIFGDEESCRYMTRPPFATVAETTAQLREWTKDSPDTSWAIVDHEQGPALGRVTVYPQGRNNVWEAACMVAPAARGRGLAHRAMALAIDYAFERKGARRIMADIDPDNVP